MKDDETRIANLKHRKVDKHFTALVDGIKVKIVSFRLKPYRDRFESGQLLVLVSKLPFPGLPQVATIQIEHDAKKLHVKGRWKGALHSPGTYTQEFLITDGLTD